MMRMGPEASLVSAKVDLRVQLAEYARWEYPREVVRGVAERIRAEAAERVAEVSEGVPVLGGLSLLAMPAVWAKQRGTDLDVPISAAPIFGARFQT